MLYATYMGEEGVSLPLQSQHKKASLNVQAGFFI